MREYLIDTVNKTVIFKFDYDEEIIIDIKRSSYNSRWNNELKHWITPVDNYSKTRIIQLIKKYNFIEDGAPPPEMVKYDYNLKEDHMRKLSLLCDLRNFTWTPRD